MSDSNSDKNVKVKEVILDIAGSYIYYYLIIIQYIIYIL